MHYCIVKFNLLHISTNMIIISGDPIFRICRIQVVLQPFVFLINDYCCIFSAPTPPNVDFKLLSSKNLSDAQMKVTSQPVSQFFVL